jgi:diadenosine tetraphosphatase ApaH/serine/threonine PP2A family protein phosphatase
VIANIERQAPDLVVCGGDLALMGAQPAEVVDRIRELGWPTVVGNTDELLWRPEESQRQEERAPKLRPLLQLLFEEYAPATNELLGEERVAWLRELPAELEAAEVLLMHAAPGDLWRAPMPDADDEELAATYGGHAAGHVVYGHIHRPYVRDVERLTVANSGSVGLPWDGNPRAAYLLVEDGRSRVVRVEYDVEREAEMLLRSGYPDAERLAEMRRLGRFLPPVSAERGTGS